MTLEQITARIQDYFAEGVVVSQTTLSRDKNNAPIIGGSVIYGKATRYWCSACEPENFTEGNIQDLVRMLCLHGFPRKGVPA